MTEFAKTIVRNVLFFVVLFCVAVGFYLLEAEVIVIAAAVVAVGAFMKFDDYRIRKSRRTI